MRFLHPGATWEDLAMQIVKAYADGDLVQRDKDRLFRIAVIHTHAHENRSLSPCSRCHLETLIEQKHLVERTYKEIPS